MCIGGRTGNKSSSDRQIHQHSNFDQQIIVLIYASYITHSSHGYMRPMIQTSLFHFARFPSLHSRKVQIDDQARSIPTTATNPATSPVAPIFSPELGLAVDVAVALAAAAVLLAPDAAVDADADAEPPATTFSSLPVSAITTVSTFPFASVTSKLIVVSPSITGHFSVPVNTWLYFSPVAI